MKSFHSIFTQQATSSWISGIVKYSLHISSNLTLSQTCGLPLVTSQAKNDVHVVAVPKYKVLGCEEHRYHIMQI